MTRSRKSVQIIHEGRFAAEVEVELHYDEESWSPTMSLADAKRLETTRLALRNNDLAEAARHGRVFELTPVAAE